MPGKRFGTREAAYESLLARGAGGGAGSAVSGGLPGISVIAGAGLTGGGELIANVTLTAGAGAGITINADDIALTTPGSLTATSTNSSTGNHTHAIDSTIARSAITITAGAGLTGGGDLTVNRTLTVGAGTLITVNADDVALSNGSAQYQIPVTGATPFTPAWTLLSTYAGNGLVFSSGVYSVGAGNGITVNANDVALTTPGTLTVSTTNSASGSHTHAITSSSNPGAAASLLASDASGDLTLQHLKLATTSNQVVFQSAGVTGTLTWTPASSGKVITLPNLTGTMALGADTATVSSTNSVTVANHTHAVTSSSNPGAAASLLASSAAGALQLVNLTLTGILTTPRVTAAANLTIDPAGDVIFDPTGNDILPNANYDLNLGALSKKYLTLYAAELVVETLVAQETIATIGGRILVAPTTVLIADLTAIATTIDVKHNQMRSGDVVLMEASGLVEWMQVASGPTTISGGYRYTVTRNLDGTGANAWYAGDAIVNTGQTGAGFIDLYSFSAMTAPPIEYVYNYNATGAAFSANYAGSSVITLFGDGANTEINDAVYFGVANTTWANLYYNLATAADYVATLVWEYWSGAAWTAFTPTTTDFKATGLVATTWTIAALTGWASTTVNAIAAYWVRVRISVFTSFTTAPVHSGARLYRSKRQYGPTIVGQVRNSATFNDYSEHWAIGNLQGWYGYATDTYGAAFGKYSATTSWLSADATNGLRIMRGAVQLAQWDISGNILIGQTGTSQSNVYLTSGGVALRNNTTTLIDLSSAGVILIGQTGAGQDNILISSGAISFRNDTTTLVFISSAVVTIGRVAVDQSNIILNDGGIALRNNTTSLIELFSNGFMQIGQSTAGQDNIIISSGAISLRNATTTLINLSSAGVITIGQVGASQNNVLISSGAIGIRNNTTERIGLTAAGILTIKDSSGNAVLTFDAAAGAEITKKLTMPGTDSAIAIGSTPPTSASAGTGLWIDRTGFYALAANVVQFKIDAATGYATAGTGYTEILSSGIRIRISGDYNTDRRLTFVDQTTPTNIIGSLDAKFVGSTTDVRLKVMPYGTGYSNYLHLESDSVAAEGSAVYINAFKNGTPLAGIIVSAGYGVSGVGAIELDGDTTVDKGLNLGSATGAGTGGISYSGNLGSVKNATTYTGYIVVPLTTPLTSTSWDGDAKSSQSATVLDLSAVFGAPPGIKAAFIQISARDSVTWGAQNLQIAVGPNATYYYAINCRPAGGDVWAEGAALVPCNEDGDVYVQITASGSLTMDVYMRIWGYCI